MKILSQCSLLSLALAGVLSACGGGNGDGGDACSGPVVGTWNGAEGDKIQLSSSCKFSYTGADSCKSTGTYSEPAGSSGTMIVKVTSSTGGECLPADEYSCVFAIEDDQMGYDCTDEGAMIYTRQ